MNLSAFKAYDIRGLYPEQVNEDLAYLVGRALVRHLSAKKIVVGRDMRLSSPALLDKVIEGATCEGADVINIGLCSTPMLNFAVANYGYDGGIMVSASHNPGQYNAFKIIGPGAIQIDETSGLLDIKKIVEKSFGQCAPKGTVTEKEVLADYLAHVMKFAEGISGLKIAVDYGNGVGSIAGKPAFARMDIDTTELYPEPNGSFPNHPANPHDVENFNDLIDAVKKGNCDLGIFFDGDADRGLFVDEVGNIVPIDLLVTLLAIEELKQKPKEKIYYDLRFSKAVADHVRKAGGEPVMMRVGNPFYKRKLASDGGIIGAEFSGHIMFAENYNMDDGLFAAIKTLKLLTESDKKLSELIELVREYEGSPEESFEAKNPDTVAERLIAAFPEAKQVELDGTYLDFPDGFISVRQSQTETQLFRIRLEAKSKEVLTERLAKVKEIVLN
jgi:phosphomannomutase